MKAEMLARFEEIFGKNQRLLAVKLDGFTHSIAWDNGSAESVVNVKHHGAYTPSTDERVKEFFLPYPNYQYQGNPKTVMIIVPDMR